MGDVSNQILDAIQILTKSRINKAGYDKTIQAQILSCEDKIEGKYKCRYQDATIYAYSNNSDVEYYSGTMVYIVLPNGDLNSSRKTIIGSTDNLGVNYINQASGDAAYVTIGSNCMSTDEVYYLDTSIKEYLYTLYDANTSAEAPFNVDAVNEYIKATSSITIGGTFTTSISPEKQFNGHYGIAYNLRFADNNDGEPVIRTYMLDEDCMVGNPYRLSKPTYQYEVFDIDGKNFVRIESIQLFCQGFPAATTSSTDRLESGDIKIESLELSAVMRLSDNDMNGICITFNAPQGNFFPANAPEGTTRKIIAELRVKGIVTRTSASIPFYWGKENTSVMNGHEKYNNILGRGWECLNSFTKTENEQGESLIEWSAGSDTLILSLEQAPSKQNKFKVAVVYEGSVITKQITIKNLGAEDFFNVTIESDSGTEFYYDIGKPILTCTVGEAHAHPDNATYYWAYQSNTGALQAIEQQTELEDYQRQIFVNKITGFAVVKCSVYINDQYRGTASITLTNSLDGQKNYSLVINNSDVVFQYNENGVAPNAKSNLLPQQFQNLSFTVYDPLGQAVDTKDIKTDPNSSIRWAFPQIDTLLIDKDNGDAIAFDDVYRYYNNQNIIYDIEKSYNIRKQRNQIKLVVNYKGLILMAETNFTFVKQGEPGTNGTEYVVKLVPNTQMSNPPIWPIVTAVGNSRYINYGIGSSAAENAIEGSSKQLLKAQLWKNGAKIWEGVSANSLLDSGPSSVKWEVLKNKYGSNSTDISPFEVSSDGVFTYDDTGIDYLAPLATIIKCTINYERKKYIGTIPITIAWVSNQIYRVSLEEYTGFRSVLYASDGTSPHYNDSYPFEFIITENGEDISNNQNMSYSYSTTNDSLLEASSYREGYNKNQCSYQPAVLYDGMDVTIGATCSYSKDGSIVGKINIPIHFLLNKFGLENINDWDGNKVEINDEGGYILAPQMGAGQKNDNNLFTGVLMGSVKQPNKSKEIGLFGFGKGQRTFFLDAATGNAYFKGEIEAGSGSKFGPWTISNTAIWKGSSNYDTEGQDNMYFGNDGLSISNKFKVDDEGNLTATGANISGNITATSLTLDGTKVNYSDIDGMPDFATNASVNSKLSNYVKTTDMGDYIEVDIPVSGTETTSEDGEQYRSFSVSKNGLLTAENAIIRGTIYAGGGEIGALSITSSGLETTNANITTYVEPGFIAIHDSDSSSHISPYIFMTSSSGDTYVRRLICDYINPGEYSGSVDCSDIRLTNALHMGSDSYDVQAVSYNTNGYIYFGANQSYNTISVLRGTSVNIYSHSNGVTIGNSGDKVYLVGSVYENGTLLSNKYGKAVSVSSTSSSVSLTKETYNTGSFSVFKNGYTPLGVVGYEISGSRSNYMNLYRHYISGTTYYWAIRNNSSETVSDTLTVYILYSKD